MSLHLALLSVAPPPSTVRQQLSVLVPASLTVSDTLSPKPSTLHKRAGAQTSDLLRPGLDQFSRQAAAGDPPGLLVAVQVGKAETLPAHGGPLGVRELQILVGCAETGAASL